MSQARAAEATLGAKPARLSFEVNVDVVCPKCRLVVLAGTRHDCEGEGGLESFLLSNVVSGKARRTGLRLKLNGSRYCIGCDEWMHARVCKACGMDTEKP